MAGVFDILHLGHIRSIKQAAELGNLTILLLSDDLTTSYKRKPIQTYWVRKATIEELPWVHRVEEKTRHDIRNYLRTIEPHYLVIGSDWTQESFYELNGLSRAYMDHNQINLVIVPNENIESTSSLIERCRVERL